MIPYFREPGLSLGPVPLNAFGTLAALGICASLLLARRRAIFLGLDLALAERMLMWMLATGFLIAHVVDCVAYFPHETFDDPLSLIRNWDGISSFGGFLGAMMGAFYFIRRAKMGPERWDYLDLMAYAFPVGWFFGRMGCFVAYDHPGVPTAFFLGQVYSDGVVRHNVGLEEALYTLPVAVLFLILGHKRRHAGGFFLGLLSVLYAPARFFLDYLRIIDVRYNGLTPGQYGSLLLLVFGVWILWRCRCRAKTNQSLP